MRIDPCPWRGRGGRRWSSDRIGSGSVADRREHWGAARKQLGVPRAPEGGAAEEHCRWSRWGRACAGWESPAAWGRGRTPLHLDASSESAGTWLERSGTKPVKEEGEVES